MSALRPQTGYDISNSGMGDFDGVLVSLLLHSHTPIGLLKLGVAYIL